MKVTPQFRTHPKSHLPGGDTLRITEFGKMVCEYDRIKDVNAYIVATLKRKLEKIIKIEILQEDGSYQQLYPYEP